MNRVLIWDLPVRFFHWLLAGGFVAAAVIALLLGEESVLFPYHSIIGLTLALMVGLRLAWGLVGTRYARLETFPIGPSAVAEYLKGVFLGHGKRHIGHNPGSACAIVVMLGLILALTVTGIMMGRGNESVKEFHEILAYSMVGVVIVHVVGVALHTLRHRENLTASMIHGRKMAGPEHAIGTSAPLAAVAFLAITGWWAVGLVRNFDAASQTTTLPLFGTTLQLGESENEGGGEEEGKRREETRGAAHDDD